MTIVRSNDYTSCNSPQKNEKCTEMIRVGCTTLTVCMREKYCGKLENDRASSVCLQNRSEKVEKFRRLAVSARSKDRPGVCRV